MIDSSCDRVHQHGAKAKKGTLPRLAGGLTTKMRMAASSAGAFRRSDRRCSYGSPAGKMCEGA